jgi:hypothetical protein
MVGLDNLPAMCNACAMKAIPDHQALAIIDLIEQGRFIGEACQALDADRVTFWRLMKARPDLQRLKKDAEDIGTSIRMDEANRIKWACYQNLPNDSKYSTMCIWFDKTAFGLREQVEIAVENRDPIKLFDIEADAPAPEPNG